MCRRSGGEGYGVPDVTEDEPRGKGMSVAQGVRYEDRPTGLPGSKVDRLGLAAGGLDERRGVLPARPVGDAADHA